VSIYGLTVLDRDECLRLLAQQHVGRVAVVDDEGPAVLPVVYALLDGDVVFRTAPGQKLIAAALHRVVAFEVDDYDDDAQSGWSVNVVGPAAELVHPDERARAEALGMRVWAGEARDRFVRISAERVTGRRIDSTS
jgi:uncharacterized protein